MRTERVVIAAVFGMAACGSGSGAGSAVSRDSAGITIVENSGAKWAEGTGWRVPDSVLVDIGGQGADTSSDMDRVAGPVRLSDGRIAFANGGTNELRIFDATGKHLASSGRAGSGPGEYQMPMGIWVGQGDSLMVFDAMVATAQRGSPGRHLRPDLSARRWCRARHADQRPVRLCSPQRMLCRRLGGRRLADLRNQPARGKAATVTPSP